MERLWIRFLTLTVGQACNLRCESCGNFAPFAPRETLRYDAETLLRSLRTITERADIRLLQIQGGEPFLYPELPRILEFVRHCPGIAACLIATNGSRIPSADVERELRQDSRFLVRISHYPVTCGSGEQVKVWLEERGIRCENYHFISADDRWYDLGTEMVRGSQADSREKERGRERFENCLFHDCLTLENGLLGRCSRAVIASRVQGFSAGEGDFLPVSDSPEFLKQLEDYIHHPRYMEACCHCNGTKDSRRIEVAVQLPKKKR